MKHRIREAMRSDELEPMGAGGRVVEVDETHLGDKGMVTKRTKRGKSGRRPNGLLWRLLSVAIWSARSISTV